MDGMPRRRLIELPPNRIWQIWVLDALAGVAASEDSHFREDWIASVTRAVNPGSTNETEKLNWGQSNRKNSTAEVDAYNDPKNRLLNRACGSFFHCSVPTFHYFPRFRHYAPPPHRWEGSRRMCQKGRCARMISAWTEAPMASG